MSEPITFDIEDALDLESVANPQWNTTGSYVGYLRTAHGETDFASLPVSDISETAVSLHDGVDEPTHRTNDGGVSTFEWRPEYPFEAALVVDGDIDIYDVETGETRSLVHSDEPCSGITWGPDGETLAYMSDGTLWLHEQGSLHACDFANDVSVASFLSGPTLHWDPSGRYLGVVTEGTHEALGLTVYDTLDKAVVWSTVPDEDESCMRASFDWVDDGHLVYAEDTMDGTTRVYRSVRIGIDDDVGQPIASESVDGLLLPHEPVGSGTGWLAVISARTGYRHIYAIDVQTRRRVVESDQPGLEGTGIIQVTNGAFEARGDASDVPSWSESGDQLAYVTNRVDPGERHLHIASIDQTGCTEHTKFTDIRGNAMAPTWFGDNRIVFLRAGRFSPADVHVADVQNETMRRLSASHPHPDRLETLPEPEPIEFEASDGATVYGYLYTPPEASSGDDIPAIVLCHGGPISQMRRGFHPGKTYCYFHGFDQALVSQGYAVLELNFRSGIGYGRDFEQAIHRRVGVDEVQDCVDAAAFLRSDERIGDAVGMWGRSYGGFLANILATKTDAYDCAVNVAGIWDWRTWEEWAIEEGRSTWGPGEASWFHNRFGGPPFSDEPVVKERYRIASPNTYVEDMDTPLLAIHGSADKNVTVEELHRLIVECVEAGVEFDSVYYPDEEHMFERPETWRDAFPRIVDFFDAHLRSSTERSGTHR
ncbi:S9 family peptidase [Natronosalvus halobius]|uniref:S9 family peptidase n=1 Tax=Natronosalvus halobius TaxID=2953746 RepID=UPI00209D0880|nr:prolyl oligopeptidase family serine peptidase [Natronosalvus halobius]USZ73682.1 prolyl oligopeptidase family serine peptidase [Natronosalvus halobius]